MLDVPVIGVYVGEIAKRHFIPVNMKILPSGQPLNCDLVGRFSHGGPPYSVPLQAPCQMAKH
jgi:hypothetical protein